MQQQRTTSVHLTILDAPWVVLGHYVGESSEKMVWIRCNHLLNLKFWVLLSCSFGFPKVLLFWCFTNNSQIDKFSLPRATEERGQAKTDKPSVHPPTVDARESLNGTRDTKESRETNDTQDSGEAGDDDASGQWHLPLAGM